MNIVYATDDKGALGTGVSIVSLMENLPADVHADIYIMTDGLNEDNTARFLLVPSGRQRRITVLASQGNFPPRWNAPCM